MSVTPRSQPRIHPLAIAEIRCEAPDAVAVRFAVPDALAADYAYTAGQYLTLCRDFDGAELRRCYSLCRRPGDPGLWIGVREEPGGRFSGWLNGEAQVGDTVPVLTPDGRFTFTPDPNGPPRELLCVAAGSGITPVLAILETLLADEPQSRATLVYANRDAAHIMFRERVEDLKDRYLSRLGIFHVLSREVPEVDLLAGRFDAAKCQAFFGPNGVAPADGFDAAYLCGPEPLMDLVADSLRHHGLDAARIRRERFLNADAPAPTDAAVRPPEPVPDGTEITIIIDGRRRRFAFDPAHSSILDAARAAGADVPYACKAGVCATCRGLLVEGEVHIARNHALDPDELERGFILSCQARPTTARVVIDYDRR
ncbi:MAG: 2Fe-2S iron-sulfur cluster binding domain-containing protein [Alphaproteobacteria bacterium]|nr:2Fe-2S iron-sulfur cluster binding domain-containing protein [Alphaproteobacteria bacterium]MCB9928040.1 2Fe-2S iron-sulfur cluster binding domain-containing protein [Alphaproteobacteria bacterium]